MEYLLRKNNFNNYFFLSIFFKGYLLAIISCIGVWSFMCCSLVKSPRKSFLKYVNLITLVLIAYRQN